MTYPQLVQGASIVRAIAANIGPLLRLKMWLSQPSFGLSAMYPVSQFSSVLGGRGPAQKNQPSADPDEDEIEQAQKHG